ncbi:endonuclease Q family protein [Terrimonas sp. NA20]|uniref:Endonuclease Q family protein n=1 Tax=Terrimonas ginsenosidimutans TaxID=2908004 RepID=A0ABS9KUJ7_9BACT|nr:endonuclease Q family protein [Terrimonas ginsenosidimutans]MCG2616017.1 endonuclease Q family protein [Terrimonas ginsenosidimutans]
MFIADLHTHSRYAQACSKFLTVETLYQWALIKGITVISSGDFTHPAWLQELQDKLVPDGQGLFRMKYTPGGNPAPGLPENPDQPWLTPSKVKQLDVRFMLSTEVSSVYSYGGKTRKNHNLIYVPDFSSAVWISKRLSRYGDLSADGRPTLSLSSRDLLEIVLETPGGNAHLVPAHAWTPWFSTLGSKGGYDSIDECFRDLSSYIFAIETGLSSDPAMNWRWSQLDRLTMLSSSDAHSAQKLGREANLFETKVSYETMFEAIRHRDGFLGTYEFFPEEGKYSWDGHRNCGVCLSPEESMALDNHCPKCGKPVTVGVMQRIEKLADRKQPLQPEKAPSFQYIIPLAEILSEIHGTGVDSKKVMKAYADTVGSFGNEFDLLQIVPVGDIHRYNPLLAEAIRRMRAGEVIRKAGYDGVYGKINLFHGKPSLETGTLF